MTKMTLLDKAGIIKSIASLSKRAKKLGEDFHLTAVSALAHAEQHGDATLCGRVVAAMGMVSRRQDMITWFAMYGPIKIVHNKKEDIFEASFFKKDDVRYRPFNVAGATSNPFWEKIEDRPNPMGFGDLVGAFYQRKAAAKKAHEEGRYVGNYDEDMRIMDRVEKAFGVDADDLNVVKEETKRLKLAFISDQKKAA